MNSPGALTVIAVNLTNMTVVCGFNKHIVIGTVVTADSACSDLFVLRSEYYSCKEIYDSAVSFHSLMVHRKGNLQKMCLEVHSLITS
jgi:hypothetical protein